MFILTNISSNDDMARVYDTDDKTDEFVNLSILAYQIISKNIKVAGLGELSDDIPKDAVSISRLNIYYSFEEAKKMAKAYGKG